MRAQNTWLGVVNHSNEISAAATAIATIFIALYTFALSDSTRALREAAEQQKLDMLESLRIAGETADAAKLSADAAKQSADSLRNIERAYVFIDYELLRKRNAELKVGGIHNKQIALAFRNFGRTPAIINGIICRCFHSPNRHLPRLRADTSEFPIGIAIGGDASWNISVVFVGTQNDIDTAMDGDGSIYLYGEAAYLDMLGDQRTTGFCCEWNFAEGQFFMSPNTELNYHT